MRSLRGRLTLGVAAIIAALLGVSGVLISEYSAETARNELDDRLQSIAELSTATAKDAIEDRSPRRDNRLNAVLQGSESSLRLVVGDGAPLFDSGTRELTGPVGPPGLRTVKQRGEEYRVLVQPVDAGLPGSLERLEIAASLDPLQARQSALDERLLQLGLGALLLAALGTFVASVRVLGPLRRLRGAARRVAAEEDLSVRVSESDGPGEVRDLAASINEMLAQIEIAAAARERALAATRRFALDAGHEIRTPLTTVQATLSTLARHPGISADQRAMLLDDALDEQKRLVDLLDGLQAYARGEASTVAHEPVDLAETVLAAVAEVRRTHRGVRIAADVPDATVGVAGWEPGLRLLVGNLVANAARHGPAGGTVHVRLSPAPGPTLVVDDEGTGIPAADRERIFTPFERLDGAAGHDGSGLGLALVAQQVREHGASVRVEDAPGGGARFVVAF